MTKIVSTGTFQQRCDEGGKKRIESISAITPERYRYLHINILYHIICTAVTGKVTQQETCNYTQIVAHTTHEYTSVHTSVTPRQTPGACEYKGPWPPLHPMRWSRLVEKIN